MFGTKKNSQSLTKVPARPISIEWVTNKIKNFYLIFLIFFVSKNWKKITDSNGI